MRQSAQECNEPVIPYFEDYFLSSRLKARPVRDIPPDLAPYSSDRPRQRLHLLFIHQSCGGQVLAQTGAALEKTPGTCIFVTHPNGGALRSALERNNYAVHEASRVSVLGRDTEVRAWRGKFQSRMEDILSCDEQDKRFRDGTRNKVVVFKPCAANGLIQTHGKEPGDPDSRERTLANYRAAYRSLLPLFRARPDTLFVAWTPPPPVRPAPSGPMASAAGIVRALLGRTDPARAAAGRARAFSAWLTDMDHGWLQGYGASNVVAFDYHDIITGYGESDWSVYPSSHGEDDNPGARGNTRAAHAFIPFLNKAAHRAGL